MADKVSTAGTYHTLGNC